MSLALIFLAGFALTFCAPDAKGDARGVVVVYMLYVLLVLGLAWAAVCAHVGGF